MQNLIRKANTRTFVLRHYSTFMSGKDLITLYSSLVRSILEYSSVTYGPMLSKHQSNRLEKVQRNCLRIMFGYGKDYGDLLSESGVETLKTRREKALAKFADKCLKNPDYSDFFPASSSERWSAKHGKKYQEFFARCDRLKNSPLYYMRRRLNGKAEKIYGKRNSAYRD